MRRRVIVPEKKLDKTEESLARFFPTTGGILKTMQKNMRPDYTYLAVDGVENCMAALHDIEEGNIEHCFIEMSACAGSCIGGPVMEKYHRMPVRDYYAVSHYAGKKDFNVAQPDAIYPTQGNGVHRQKAALPIRKRDTRGAAPNG